MSNSNLPPRTLAEQASGLRLPPPLPPSGVDMLSRTFVDDGLEELVLTYRNGIDTDRKRTARIHEIEALQVELADELVRLRDEREQWRKSTHARILDAIVKGAGLRP